MISRPLFKQSVKANKWTWLFVTVLTCAMLAIILSVLGNLNIDEIRGSLTDTFVKDKLETQVEKQSMTYFYMSDSALTNYETSVETINTVRDGYLYLTTVDGDGNPYNGNQQVLTDTQARYVLTNGKTESETQSIGAIIDMTIASQTHFSDEEVSTYVLNIIADGIYDKLVDDEGTETAESAKTFVSAAIKKFVDASKNDATLTATEFATNYIPDVLDDAFFDQTFVYDGDEMAVCNYLTLEEIHAKAYSAIMSFRAEMSVKETQLKSEVAEDENFADLSAEEQAAEVASRLADYADPLIGNLSKGIVDSLPQNVADSLTELGNMDIYELIVGSIFYKIAGLLLPIIYVIMVANNLVAGQVDSGSMAYVLSTPTKRRKVMSTQIAYMVLSLVAMFGATTLTGLITLNVVGTDKITVTVTELLLLNLGALVTMLAISGICYLASCWFNRSYKSLSCGGGVSMFFLVSTILGLFGSEVIPSAIRIKAMNYFNYCSLITLFDVTSILDGTTTYLWKLAILVGIALLTYTIGAINFDKKDLPL